MENIAKTPEPPYYAVMFTSKRSGFDDGYGKMSERMIELASKQPGFLGIESAHDSDTGITISYWKDLESIRAWKEDAEHQNAQYLGREKWYEQYTVRIARVERAYGFGL